MPFIKRKIYAINYKLSGLQKLKTSHLMADCCMLQVHVKLHGNNNKVMFDFKMTRNEIPCTEPLFLIPKFSQ